MPLLLDTDTPLPPGPPISQLPRLLRVLGCGVGDLTRSSAGIIASNDESEATTAGAVVGGDMGLKDRLCVVSVEDDTEAGRGERARWAAGVGRLEAGPGNCDVSRTGPGISDFMPD